MSIASELERWAALLDRGLITREEFDQEKRILMANATNGSNPSLGGGSQPGIGKSLGAYNILGMVGRGGMGVVYRARHRSGQIASRQGGDVALKVLHAQYSQDPTFQERFEREATLGLKLDHAGIVKVYDLIVAEGGRLALAMELIKGQELSNLIGKVRGPIPWREALAMFDGLLDAVSHAHSKGVIHRDLKPENIMVCEGGGLKVLDFGIARDESSGKTKTGTGMGTVDYMAPEQYTDASNVDARADIYALGMTLYEMVAGRLPWAANATEFEVLNAKAAGDLPPPTQFYPDIPPELVSVLEQAMDVNMGRRFESADAFRSALQGVIRRTDTAAKKAREEEVQRVKADSSKVLQQHSEPEDNSMASPEVPKKVGAGWRLVSVAIIVVGLIGILVNGGQGARETLVEADRFYYGDQGVDLNFYKSARLYEKACDQGSARGCLQWALQVQYGQGVRKDEALGDMVVQSHPEAVWKVQGACDDSDDLRACTCLGEILSNGVGVPDDNERAVRLYKKACDGDEMAACFNLGVLYKIGRGVPKQPEKALSLFQSACDAGFPWGCSSISKFYMEGTVVRKDIELALHYLVQACDSGLLSSCVMLGTLYRDGEVVGKDERQAFNYYQQACDGRDSDGCIWLGVVYQLGKGVRADKRKAIKWYEESCALGSAGGCYLAGKIYEEDGPYELAQKSYQQCCDWDDADCCDLLRNLSAH